MIGFLVATIATFGSLGVGLLITVITIGLFREIVNVANSEANSDKEIPWFRSILWAWFTVAMYVAYTADNLKAPMRLASVVRRMPAVGGTLAWPLEQTRYHGLVALYLYAGTFVATVLSLRLKHLAVQLHILGFTVLALSLFVVPMKMAIHNAFVGLFWFVFPCALVAVNDTFAYLAGYACGRKLIQRPFLAISPNKTWEGFLGGGLATLVAGSMLPLLLAQPALTCSYDALEAARGGSAAACAPPALFSRPSLGGFKEVQFHGLCLAAFAACVAPFGGFAASAIKRAYGIKDFAALIPGHGGFFDRLDCQFLMALATFVHLKTFVLDEGPVEKLLHFTTLLAAHERAEFLRRLSELPFSA
jgi:phosphatidate cytidylyltransferase